jgi:hypothetical protein
MEDGDRHPRAYVKALEAAGVDRAAAEAQVEAMSRHVLQDLVGKTDLAATRSDLEQTMERMEHRLIQRMDKLAHDLTVRLVGFMLAITGLMNAVLFALLRIVPLSH